MISILRTAGWDDYALLDSGEGFRLEQFGKYTVARPDPQAIWERKEKSLWRKVDASFGLTSEKEGWEAVSDLPDKWTLKFQDLSFYAKLTPFKHTGIFPEQSLHWDFIMSTIKKSDRPTNILNLFGYTGIATLAAASAGAKVTHVDASRPSIGWARENQELSNLSDKPIRWILDDAVKFVQREVRRGVSYDGIIMDPPVYGHGPEGERWDFHKDFPNLLSLCQQVLTPQPLFVIVNAYAISSSSLMLFNLMEQLKANHKGTLSVGELVLEEKKAKRPLSTGIFARWSS